MIVCEEISNINTLLPKQKTAWGNFYSYCWKTHITNKSTSWEELVDTLSSELALHNANLEYRPNKYKTFKVTFANDEDYTLFTLRWS